MFGFRKSPANKASNESKYQQTNLADRRTSSEPVLNGLNNPFDDNYGGSGTSSSAAARDRYKNDFSDSGGLENQSVQELENYAVYKAEETTKSANNCLQIAEDIRQDATKTLDMLHAQGEQMTRTHHMAADMDKDLKKGEKLLNSLGGMFSKPWKPKKTREITGPLITADNSHKVSQNRKKQREELGLAPKPVARSAPVTPPPEANALQKVEVEKARQDGALSDLSDVLGDLKCMAADMGSELDRQNKALDHLSVDVDELNSRVKGANQRTRRLLEK